MLMYHSGLICLTVRYGYGYISCLFCFLGIYWNYIGTRIYTPKHVLKYYHILAWLRVKCSPMYFKDFHSTFCFVLCFVSVATWYDAWASASLISSQRCSCSVSQAWRGAAVLWDPSVSFSLCALCSHISSCETPGRNTHISESRSC